MMDHAKYSTHLLIIDHICHFGMSLKNRSILFKENFLSLVRRVSFSTNNAPITFSLYLSYLTNCILKSVLFQMLSTFRDEGSIYYYYYI